MEIEIGGRKSSLFLRLFMQLFSICCLGLVAGSLPFPEKQGQPINALFLEILILTVLGLTNLWNFLGLVYVPIGVKVDSENKLLSVKYLLSKAKVIALGDIANYCSTIINVRSGKYTGILVYLNDGTQIMVSKWNLTDYIPVESFLVKSGVENQGKETFAVFSYYTQFWNKK